MGVTGRSTAADPETMRILAAIVALCVFAPVASAGRPVAVMAADVVVNRHAHVVTASTIVVDDANQVLDRRYRTTLRYRCGARWLTARRIARGPASATVTWRYPRRLAGKLCEFRIVVARIGQAHLARSAVLRRAL
jgi:hypothetical protein